MAWLKSHSSMATHPKVFMLSQRLGIPTVSAIGHLHLLWYAALEKQEDGDLSCWPDEVIAHNAYWNGNPADFVVALRECGWLDGRLIHDWLDYAGRFLEGRYAGNSGRLAEIWATHGKQRGEKPAAKLSSALASNLQANRQETSKHTCKPACELPLNVRVKSKELRDTTKTTISSAAAAPDALSAGKNPTLAGKTPYPQEFETFWQAYPRKVGKAAALKRWKTQKPPLTEVLKALELQRACGQWQDISLIPHPETWINKRRWEDDPAAYAPAKPVMDNHAYCEADSLHGGN
ncbi:MAG TPA: hypothetical protein PLL10_02255 [Elusimicrobiales bacterium]|nr:hypothetical protein [Elusimicrobiales bacterium]